MTIFKEVGWEDIKPWAGAKYWYEIIDERNKGSAFLDMIEELYPGGIDETELNDILWFEDELICDFLNIDYNTWYETGKLEEE